MKQTANDFVSLVILAFEKEVIKKLVFSRPINSKIQKISGRMCAHRGRKIMAFEYSLPENTVSQKNISQDNLEDFIRSLTEEYKQVNLITTSGDAEWKISKSGNDALLGGDSLRRKLLGEKQAFESAIEALDRKKNYILDGNEEFLITLGISDKNGRVHDKKQGKFRQINRMLEHVEDIYDKLPSQGKLLVYDLCCGKSYLSFAVYHYLTINKKRAVELLGIDLKSDVISWCDGVAKQLGYNGMTFVCDNITNTPKDKRPDMVISLHACDIATDVVIDSAIKLNAKVILSTPCCHRYLNDKIKREELEFVTAYPQLRNKLCEAFTDAIRIARLNAAGYNATALELTDPENTPKNTLIRAYKEENLSDSALNSRKQTYKKILDFVLSDNVDSYLNEIK